MIRRLLRQVMKSPEADFEFQRNRMVETQLAARGIVDGRVLAAMRRIPREVFVPKAPADDVYDDCPLIIDCNQTISQPYTVAFMAEALELSPTDRVLEIGTGSGYGAAILSCLAAEVFTIERHALLAEQAESRLRQLNIGNVRVFIGDGSLGLPEEGPFNAICVTARSSRLPHAFRGQLADGGRIVMPIGEHPSEQQMLRYRRTGDFWSVDDLGTFAFVPLVGADALPTDVRPEG